MEAAAKTSEQQSFRCLLFGRCFGAKRSASVSCVCVQCRLKSPSPKPVNSDGQWTICALEANVAAAAADACSGRCANAALNARNVRNRSERAVRGRTELCAQQTGIPAAAATASPARQSRLRGDSRSV